MHQLKGKIQLFCLDELFNRHSLGRDTDINFLAQKFYSPVETWAKAKAREKIRNCLHKMTGKGYVIPYEKDKKEYYKLSKNTKRINGNFFYDMEEEK